MAVTLNTSDFDPRKRPGGIQQYDPNRQFGFRASDTTIEMQMKQDNANRLMRERMMEVMQSTATPHLLLDYDSWMKHATATTAVTPPICMNPLTTPQNKTLLLL